MRIGITYMGHHDPRCLKSEIRAMASLGIDDLLVTAQENDFAYFPGKLRFTPRIAADHGLRPAAIFWGALNLFGGGRSSQFLLEHPEGFQVGLDGVRRPAGCYVNPACVTRIREMIDTAAGCGFRAYFIDEPSPLRHCYCASCRAAFREESGGGDLAGAGEQAREAFRRRRVIAYVREIAAYCRAAHPGLETMTCLMPVDRAMWAEAARVEELDNLGTDLYWVNNDRDVEEMAPLVRELDALCRASGKVHHQWLQCWNVRAGREGRILEQGRVLVREKPGAIYVWAWRGQVGTAETCDDPDAAWRAAAKVLRLAGEC